MTVLLFVATIVTFVGIDYLVRRSKGESTVTETTTRPVAALRFPEGVFFSKTHTWLNLFPSGIVQLGVDDFVKRMFANPQVTLLKSEGESVSKGESIIRMEEGGNAFFVHSPIEGRITRLNTRSAATVHEDHFVQGWAYAIEPKGGASELRNFFLGAETRTWIKSEFARLRDFIASASSPAEYASVCLQDGGEPMPGILNTISPKACIDFEKQFLANN